jgi:hypothetical protein
LLSTVAKYDKVLTNECQKSCEGGFGTFSLLPSLMEILEWWSNTSIDYTLSDLMPISTVPSLANATAKPFGSLDSARVSINS